MLLLLSKYWPVPVVLFLLAGAFLAHKSAVRDADKAGYARAVGEAATQVAIANAKTDTLDLATRMKSNEAAVAWESTRDGLQSQITGLLAQPAAQPIRLCKPAPNPRPVPGAVADSAGVVDTTGGREPTLRVGRDIRGPLILHGGRCEKDRLNLIELQRLLSTAK